MSKKMVFCPICGSKMGVKDICQNCGYTEADVEDNYNSIKEENSINDPNLQLTSEPVQFKKPESEKNEKNNEMEQELPKHTEKFRAIWDFFKPYLSEIGKWAWIILIIASLVDITITTIILAVTHGAFWATSIWEYIRNGILLVIAFWWVEPNFSPKLKDNKWNDLLEDDFGVKLEKISNGKIQIKYRIPMMFIMGIIIEICSPLYIIGLVVLWPALLLMFFGPMSPYNWNKPTPSIEN